MAFLDETGVTQLTSNIKTLADAAYPKQGAVASSYSTSSTYAVGDYCIYGGLLYKCTTAIATAEAWNSAHWTSTALANELGGGGGTLYVTVTYTGSAYESDKTGTEIENAIGSGMAVYVINGTNFYTLESADISQTMGTYTFGNTVSLNSIVTKKVFSFQNDKSGSTPVLSITYAEDVTDPSTYVVTITYVQNAVGGAQYRSDKTYAEIYTAIQSGKNVICKYGSSVYMLYGYTDSYVSFRRYSLSYNYGYEYYVTIRSTDGNIAQYNSNYLYVPSVPSHIVTGGQFVVYYNEGNSAYEVSDSPASDISQLFSDEGELYECNISLIYEKQQQNSDGSGNNTDEATESYSLVNRYTTNVWDSDSLWTTWTGYLVFKTIVNENGVNKIKTFTIEDSSWGEWQGFADATITYSEEEIGGTGLPNGGTAGQVLIKNSANDGDASWGTVQALPSGGTNGQILTKRGSEDGVASWTSTAALGLYKNLVIWVGYDETYDTYSYSSNSLNDSLFRTTYDITDIRNSEVRVLSNIYQNQHFDRYALRKKYRTYENGVYTFTFIFDMLDVVDGSAVLKTLTFSGGTSTEWSDANLTYTETEIGGGGTQIPSASGVSF